MFSYLNKPIHETGRPGVHACSRDIAAMKNGARLR
jgi:hypothetical protein